MAEEDNAAPNWMEDIDMRHIRPPAATPPNAVDASAVSAFAPAFVLSSIDTSDCAPFIRSRSAGDKFKLLIVPAKALMASEAASEDDLLSIFEGHLEDL